MHRLLPAAASLAAIISTSLSAQIGVGNSVVTLIPSGAATTGEMYEINHQTRAATALTLSATLTNARVNSVYMVSPALGYVTTNPLTPGPGDIYRIAIAGTTVTETKLNTTATVFANPAQIGIVGSKIYFTTQNASNTGGVLQSVPVAGGAVTTELDLSTVTGFVGLANGMVAIGTNLYIGTFGGAPDDVLIRFDTTTNMASVVMTLPKSKIGTGTTSSVATVWMIQHPEAPTDVVLLGVNGDLIQITVATATVVRHDFSGAGLTGARTSNLVNSFAYDPRTRDFIIGTRDGNVERVADGHSAEKVIPNVGSTPATASINGVHHFPAPLGIDYTNGPGCPASGGFTLTSADTGLPTSGNANFRLACYSGIGGAAGALVIGTSNPQLDLTIFGFPGCVLRASTTITLGVTLSGTGNGAGQASVPLPIPNNVVGATIYHQWVQVQTTPTILLAVSNGRRLTVQ